MFDALDRKESNGKISYIEEINDSSVISEYINGNMDILDPLCVIGSKTSFKSLFCCDLYNEDCTILINGGYNHNKEFITDKSILLTGILDEIQPLLSNSINNLMFPNFLKFLDDDVIEFLNIFSCTKMRVISKSDLDFLQENNYIDFTDDFYDALEKSSIVLNSYYAVKKKII